MSIRNKPSLIRPAQRQHKACALIGALVIFALVSACGSDSGASPVAAAKPTPSATASRAAAHKAVVRTTTTLPPAPVVTTSEVVETQPIAFAKVSREDASLAKGTSRITTPGISGVRTLTYRVTYNDGVETGRELLSDVVTTAPVDEVTTVGTYVEPPPPPPTEDGCDPNYEWACVPIASDVDCLGGSGDGPEYVQGPVKVVGTDIYDLDRDGDGIGCDS